VNRERLKTSLNVFTGKLLGSFAQLKPFLTPSIILSFELLKALQAFNPSYLGNADYSGWLIGSLQHAPWTYWFTSITICNLELSNCHHVAITYLASPYSIIWYWFYTPLAQWGMGGLFTSLFIIDKAVLGLVFKYARQILLPYVIGSLFFYKLWPHDILIFWLLIAAYFWWPMLIAAPLVKLPLGAPLSVWQYIFNSPLSIHDPQNWLSYGTMGLFWFGALIVNIRRWRKA